MSYTDVFGGENIFPSQLSYIQITFSADIELQWPREQQIGGTDVVADFMDMEATVASLTVTMPSASATGTGNKATFNNIGSESFAVEDNDGGSIVTIAPGEQWIVVLTDNTTNAGTWTSFQLGATVSVSNAGALAGAGIKAITTSLNQKIDSTVEASTPFTVVEADRANCTIYTAGAGTCNLPNQASVGNDWFFMIRNSGSGTLNIVPPSGQIDGGSSLNLDPRDSCFIFTDGSNYFTVGLSQGSTIAFDFIELAVPGSGDFVLSGANLDRISYRFTGALTGNRRIVVPNTTQQYWADNQTTGAFDLEVSTNAGSGVTVPQGDSVITYCDGTDVINAVTSASVTFPIQVSQGGTGATTASGARTNLQAAFSGQLINTNAQSGLAGGGDLSADRNLTLDINNLNTVALTTTDFFAFEDITGGNVTVKAQIQDILDLAPGAPLPTSTVEFASLSANNSGGWLERTDFQIDGDGNILVQPLSGIDATADVHATGATADASVTVRGDDGGMAMFWDESTNERALYETSDTGAIGNLILVRDTSNRTVLTENSNNRVARTVAAASGGLEVNNTSTGAGFERVLTTSDIVADNSEWDYIAQVLDDVVVNNSTSLTLVSDLTIDDTIYPANLTGTERAICVVQIEGFFTGSATAGLRVGYQFNNVGHISGTGRGFFTIEESSTVATAITPVVEGGRFTIGTAGQLSGIGVNMNNVSASRFKADILFELTSNNQSGDQFEFRFGQDSAEVSNTVLERGCTLRFKFFRRDP